MEDFALPHGCLLLAFLSLTLLVQGLLAQWVGGHHGMGFLVKIREVKSDSEYDKK